MQCTNNGVTVCLICNLQNPVIVDSRQILFHLVKPSLFASFNTMSGILFKILSRITDPWLQSVIFITLLLVFYLRSISIIITLHQALRNILFRSKIKSL